MPRPVQSFNDFVGQTAIVKIVRRQIEGSLARKKPFPHSLITGSSGLGKTLLGNAIATGFTTDCIVVQGEICASDLAEQLRAMKSNDVLFIDEAHRLSAAAQEILLDAIDNLRVPAPDGMVQVPSTAKREETYAAISPCTTILATDRPGQLTNALRKRMQFDVTLKPYPDNELREIVDRMAAQSNMLLSPQAANLVARISHGLPRRVKHVLMNLQNHFPFSEEKQLSVDDVREFMRDYQIDEQGLGPNQIEYLGFLEASSVASLESIAIALGVDAKHVRSEIEPLLIRERLVAIGRNGRQLTTKGREWITQQQRRKE